MKSAAALTISDVSGAPGNAAERRRDDADEFARGLPAPLPAGERLVWQGAPSFRHLARQIFHVRLLAAYFLIAAAWSAGTVIHEAGGVEDALFSAAFALTSGALVVGIFSLLAWLAARSTVYSITTNRIVMRIGVALSKTIDIPFKAINSVQLNVGANGVGNISIETSGNASLPYLMLWPHVRPWRLRHPEPMLRAVPDAETIAASLANCIRAADDLNTGNVEVAEAESTDSRSQTQERSPPFAQDRMRIPLLAAAALVVLSLVTVAIVQLNGAISERAEARTPNLVHQLSFQDIGSNRLAVVDRRLGKTLAYVEPGRDGLVQNAVRGLNRVRKLRKLPIDGSYQLVIWNDGRVTLSDLATTRHIPLSSFGPTTGGALAALLELSERKTP